MTGPGRMMKIMTMKNSGKEPVARKRTIFPILGAILLMTCLLAGFAQAADTGIGLSNNGIVPEGGSPGIFNGPAYGEISLPVNLTGAETIDMSCTSHTVACYDRYGNLLGTVGSGCSFVFIPPHCSDDFDNMKKNCVEKYGNSVYDAISKTSCYWE